MKRAPGGICALLITLGGCVNSGGGALTSGTVETEDMPLFCALEASAFFDVRVRDILISPIDGSGGISTLRGQYSGDAEEVHGFQCQFDPDGNFISVIPTDQFSDEG
jgi:hypothetical protein